jgi:hypothetical protein
MPRKRQYALLLASFVICQVLRSLPRRYEAQAQAVRVDVAEGWRGDGLRSVYMIREKVGMSMLRRAGQTDDGWDIRGGGLHESVTWVEMCDG